MTTQTRGDMFDEKWANFLAFFNKTYHYVPGYYKVALLLPSDPTYARIALAGVLRPHYDAIMNRDIDAFAKEFLQFISVDDIVAHVEPEDIAKTFAYFECFYLLLFTQ